ncbi:MAG TPA: serine protease [Solirubrobacteraceae bacterium]
MSPRVAVAAPAAAAVAALAATAIGALAGCGGATRSSPPTVLQVTASAPGRTDEFATAFAAGDGRAITVAHALAGARAVLLAAPHRRGRRVRVVRADGRLDLALLSVPGLKAPMVRTARPQAGQGTRVLVVRGDRRRVLRAKVRRLITARVRDGPGAVARIRPAFELDAAVLPGDSGAPVLDGDGRLVGMIFAQASDRADRAYALDARALGSALR